MNNTELDALTNMVLDRMHEDFEEDCPFHRFSKEQRTEMIDAAIEGTNKEFGLPLVSESLYCIICNHDKWLSEKGTCKHILPVEHDQLYTERRCGCKCKFVPHEELKAR